eukprot:TRINITY_DN60390_c0_g1_i2.p1 TRINITY_DN60390_c0_g1~~TRINITY_DN60390_c0_g1_i2.p1  ORF type:complete len:212 (-),score=55.53 TRINITY_DN60390_c0_g1_i2:245-880(-)
MLRSLVGSEMCIRDSPITGEQIQRTSDKVCRRERVALDRLRRLLEPKTDSAEGMEATERLWDQLGVTQKLEDLERFAMDRDAEGRQMHRKISQMHNEILSLSAKIASLESRHIQERWMSTLRPTTGSPAENQGARQGSEGAEHSGVSPSSSQGRTRTKRSASRWLDESPELQPQLHGVAVEPSDGWPSLRESGGPADFWKQSLREDLDRWD